MKLWSLMLLIMGGGCVADDPMLNVSVCGDAKIPAEIDGYRLSVFDETLSRELASGTEDLVMCPEEVTLSLPRRASFPVVSGESWVRVQGLRNGIVVSTFDRRVRTDGESDVDVKVGMTRACLGVSCPKGQTCYDGMCELARFDSSGSVCRSDVEPVVEIPDDVPICPDNGSTQ